MSKKSKKITVQGQDITVFGVDQQDFISLTDIAKHKTDDPSAVIANWMRNRNPIEFLGVWESLYNPDFKPLEFEGFKKGNIRDYANVSQLLCLANLENLNAVFINDGLEKAERLLKLNQIAVSQMKILLQDHGTTKRLGED